MSSWQYGLFVVESRARLAELAAQRLLLAAEAAIAAGGHFTIALSGGSTPGDLFRLLASPEWSGRLPWGRTQVFWGDERCVPPDDERSNYRLARETLLDQVPIPAENVHRMRGEAADRDAAAAEYADEITRFVRRDPSGVPRFDLLLQGLGGDGHTASLLPGSVLVHEQTQWVAVSDKEREGTIRLTITPPILHHAAVVLFLVAGADKASALREVLEGEDWLEQFPAQVVRRAQGKVAFIVDQPAAVELSDVGAGSPRPSSNTATNANEVTPPPAETL